VIILVASISESIQTLLDGFRFALRDLWFSITR